MISPVVIISFILFYMGALFLVETWVERRSKEGKSLPGGAIIYAASLGIYCTTWTYYGSVGKAATSGLMFLPVYLGPTLVFVFGQSILKRLVRLKNKYRITNIADLIAVRYGKSETLAALVTIICLIDIIKLIL